MESPESEGALAGPNHVCLWTNSAIRLSRSAAWCANIARRAASRSRAHRGENLPVFGDRALERSIGIRGLPRRAEFDLGVQPIEQIGHGSVVGGLPQGGVPLPQRETDVYRVLVLHRTVEGVLQSEQVDVDATVRGRRRHRGVERRLRLEEFEQFVVTALGDHESGQPIGRSLGTDTQLGFAGSISTCSGFSPLSWLTGPRLTARGAFSA